MEDVENVLHSWASEGPGRSWKIIRSPKGWTVSVFVGGWPKAIKVTGPDLEKAAKEVFDLL